MRSRLGASGAGKLCALDAIGRFCSQLHRWVSRMKVPSLVAAHVVHLRRWRWWLPFTQRAFAATFPSDASLRTGSHGQSAREITPEMRAEARGHVNGWLYEIRGNFGPDDFIPFNAIVGWWRVDSSGEIIDGSFESNPDFRGTSNGGT